MIGLISRYSTFVAGLSLAARCALLTSAVVLVAVPASLIAWTESGAVEPTLSLRAALLAAALCWGAGLVALLMAHRGRGTPSAVAWILAGDGIAMTLPIATAMWLQSIGDPLISAGFFKWVVLFFLATLTARTLLVAPFVNAAPRQASRSPNAEAGI
ncbi:MAG: hypothetical protein QM775_36760 [Pirellulales bacterium]